MPPTVMVGVDLRSSVLVEDSDTIRTLSTLKRDVVLIREGGLERNRYILSGATYSNGLGGRLVNLLLSLVGDGHLLSEILPLSASEILRASSRGSDNNVAFLGVS